MDSRSTEIIAQSTLKCAAEVCRGVDLSTPEGQAEFAIGYSFLLDLVMETITSSSTPDQQAAQIIQGNFPGSTVVSGNETPTYNPPPQQQAFGGGGGPPYSLSVKGTQHGPLPEWLFEQAAKAGVTEVYDNRDRAASNDKYPHFKATTGGPQAKPFWPPRG